MLGKFARQDESDPEEDNGEKMDENSEFDQACTYEVWISRDEIVDFLLYAASLDASVATRSKISEMRRD